MTFTFSDQQVQYIVNVLGQRPLAEAIELWTEIQRQAAQQAQAQRAGPQLVSEAPQQSAA